MFQLVEVRAYDDNDSETYLRYQHASSVVDITDSSICNDLYENLVNNTPNPLNLEENSSSLVDRLLSFNHAVFEMVQPGSVKNRLKLKSALLRNVEEYFDLHTYVSVLAFDESKKTDLLTFLKTQAKILQSDHEHSDENRWSCQNFLSILENSKNFKVIIAFSEVFNQNLRETLGMCCTYGEALNASRLHKLAFKDGQLRDFLEESKKRTLSLQDTIGILMSPAFKKVQALQNGFSIADLLKLAEALQKQTVATQKRRTL